YLQKGQECNDSHILWMPFMQVMEDGSVCDTFTHKSLLPEDMDPLTVRGTLGSDGVLVVSVQRLPGVGGEGGCQTAREPRPSQPHPTFDS
ncbi:hypothetical protein CRUP_035054, partial [Coryphaenoides rupestris]